MTVVTGVIKFALQPLSPRWWARPHSFDYIDDSIKKSGSVTIFGVDCKRPEASRQNISVLGQDSFSRWQDRFQVKERSRERVEKFSNGPESPVY